LYPAISVDIVQKGWEISAVFPGRDGKSADFMFQGDYENDTLISAVPGEENSVGNANSE